MAESEIIDRLLSQTSHLVRRAWAPLVVGSILDFDQIISEKSVNRSSCFRTLCRKASQFSFQIICFGICRQTMSFKIVHRPRGLEAADRSGRKQFLLYFYWNM